MFSDGVHSWNKNDLVSRLQGLARLDDESEFISSDLSVWGREFLAEKAPLNSVRTQLNTLSAQIMESDDKDLIELFRRARQNMAAVHPSGTDDVALTPFTFHKKHFQEPPYLTPSIHVTLDVREDKVITTSEIQVQRQGPQGPLVLDGREHAVKELWVNGELVDEDDYVTTKHELILMEPPVEDNFTVKIVSHIDPFNNKSMEGLYCSKGILVSQCEAEGARRIFHCVDKPCNRMEVTTTIIADKERYPFRLSNGNITEERDLENGRALITWHDPHNKPSYIFGVVLGKFDHLEDRFVTRSGREVSLQVYVEPGREKEGAYSLWALKKSMEFDEKFYDREYDLDNLIMVGVPDFNAGAMENKGLMVFNSPALLVHPDSGTDAQFRSVAHTVMHEYAHNYSGNRVTVKYFYEAALKEGYTDARAQHFSEWLFGQDFIRPKDVLRLQEAAHPQMMSKDKSHPVNGDSYIDSFELYDGITYINGREIFRLGKELLDSERPELFREAQNAYFDRFDNQAVTFEQYMGVLREFSGRDLDAYERWFEQEGVPQVQAQLLTEENGNLSLLLEQSCPHPKTGDAQKPFHIPINVELIDRDGTVIKPKELIHLTEERMEVSLGSAENADQPIPVLLHGYTAPIRLNYDYSLEALEIIISHVDDAYCQWKACRDYQRIIIRDAMQQLANGVDPSEIQWKDGLVETYKKALTNPKLPVLAKARLLSFPTLRQVVGGDEEYDFVAAAEARRALSKFLAGALKEELRTELLQNPAPSDYDPYHPDFTKHMELREFQGCALGLLAKNKEQDFLGRLFELMQHSHTFQDYSQIVGILSNDAEWGPKALDHYADRWQHDLDNFNRWIALQANSSEACPESLNTALEHPAFKRENPNHIRSLVRGFINNLDCYHKADGSGYAWVVDRILEVEKTNEGLALGYFCRGAFIDYAHMKPAQQALMMEQAKRLANESQSDPIQAFAKRFIEQYAG